MSTEPDSEEHVRDHPTTDSPAERLMRGPGELGDTGSVTDSQASGSHGSAVHTERTFAEQDAQKHPGDGPNARD